MGEKTCCIFFALVALSAEMNVFVRFVPLLACGAGMNTLQILHKYGNNGYLCFTIVPIQSVNVLNDMDELDVLELSLIHI